MRSPLKRVRRNEPDRDLIDVRANDRGLVWAMSVHGYRSRGEQQRRAHPLPFLFLTRWLLQNRARDSGAIASKAIIPGRKLSVFAGGPLKFSLASGLSLYSAFLFAILKAMTLFSDTPIFEPWEVENLKTNQYVSPYAAITKPQLVGLLTALGEYAIRVGIYQRAVMGTVLSDPELAEKRRALVGFYSRRRDTSNTASSGQLVFHAQERGALSLHKYVRGCEDIRKREVLVLLEALGRYSLDAPRIEQVFGPLRGLVRTIHAHNALVRFRDKPFTQDEFAESVRAVLNGENSRL
jgi:hypothetical protein